MVLTGEDRGRRITRTQRQNVPYLLAYIQKHNSDLTVKHRAVLLFQRTRMHTKISVTRRCGVANSTTILSPVFRHSDRAQTRLSTPKCESTRDMKKTTKQTRLLYPQQCFSSLITNPEHCRLTSPPPCTSFPVRRPPQTPRAHSPPRRRLRQARKSLPPKHRPWPPARPLLLRRTAGRRRRRQKILTVESRGRRKRRSR